MIIVSQLTMTFLIPSLYALGWLSIEWLYVLIFLTSIVSTIFGPALVSFVPVLVKPSELVSANALVQSTNNIGTLIGPAISGIGIALIGAQNVLYVNAATFLVSALCLMPIRVPTTGQTNISEHTLRAETVMQELRAGFSFVFGRQHTVFLLAIIAALYNIGASAFIFLLPVYAKESLQVGPVQLGWLWSALGVGMLLASTWLASIRQGDVRNRLRIIARAMTVGGLSVCSLSMAAFPFDGTNRIFPTERQHLDRQWKRIAQQGHSFRLIYDNDPVTGVGRYDFLSQESATAAFDEIELRVDLIGAIDRDIDRPYIVVRQ